MSLRPLTESDLLTILEWRNSPSVRESMITQHQITIEEHRNWFSRMQGDKNSRWYIYEDEAGNSNGVIYFTQYLIEWRNSFWGFYANPNAIPGIGSCMLIEALDHAFLCLGLHKLNAEVIFSNSKSINLHRKLGFRKEGEFRDFHFNGNHFVNVIRFGILKKEWLRKRSQVTVSATSKSQCKIANHG